nr:hypothetical protein [uncultured Oscillibacter sp.]
MLKQELTDLMVSDWTGEDKALFAKANRFLALTFQSYKMKKSLTEEIDWSRLNAHQSLGDFGYNCGQAVLLLDRLKTRETLPKNAASRSGIQTFLSNDGFQNYCRRSLSELQQEAQRLLNKTPETPRSKEAREIESTQESFQDVQQVYTDVQKALEQSKKYAESANDYVRAAYTLRKKMAQLKIETVNAQHAAEGIIPNMLTTLGVFIAIVVAVVGCYLSLIFNKHQNPDFPTLNLSVCLLMGHILLNVIFLLMYLISKLTNYTLACHCHFSRQMDCGSCPNAFRQHCRLPNRIWLRYPYVVLLNLVFFSAYFILGLWYFFCSYLGCRIDQFFLNHHFRVFSAMFLMAALFVGFLFAALVLMSRNSKLKAAAAAEPNGGSSTEEDLELRRQISALSDRVEMVEALYEGRKDAAVKP